jgi:hypothetical protein
VAKRKKKTEDLQREIVSEWDDWKSGDLAWAEHFATKKIFRCEVREFHPKDRHGPAATVYEQAEGCFRTVLVSSLRDTPHKRKRKDFIRKSKKK